jgi:hypothetical protein
LPRLPGIIERGNALRASASGYTESMVGRTVPSSTSRASSASCSGLGSTTKYATLVLSASARRRLLSHRDHPPALSQQPCGARKHLAADGVEDEIDSFDRALETDGLTVHRFIRTERERMLHSGARRGGPDHVGAAPARELGRQLPNSARCSVNQHPLPSRSRPWTNNPCHALSPASGIAALSTCPSVRGLGKVRRRHQYVLGSGAVPVEAGQRPDCVANGEVRNVDRERHDYTRQLVRGDRRQPLERPLEFVRVTAGA